MARQEEIIAQTIANMKRAMLRKADDSESDESIKRPSNRGNKLKRKAKFVEEGRLDQANNARASRRRINYNGYFREVISRNPMRVDHDGDVVDVEDEDSALELEDFEEDPYSDVNIATLLRPLTAASELKTHPTLSIPYTSTVLDEMLQHAQEMVFREEEALWRIKVLTSEFRGDSAWMPVGSFESEHDLALLGPITADPSTAASDVADGDVGMEIWDALSRTRSSATMQEAAGAENADVDGSDGTASVTYQPHDAYEAPPTKDRIAKEPELLQTNGSTFDEREETAQKQHLQNGHINGEHGGIQDGNGSSAYAQEEETPSSATAANGEGVSKGHVPPNPQPPEQQPVNGEEQDKQIETTNDTSANKEGRKGENDDQGDNDDNEEEEDSTADDNTHAPHRMTTRAKAQAATSTAPNSPGNPSSPSGRSHFIHPFFIPPTTSLPSREFGLPHVEADETRKLLCAYVQKQEEVCRAVNRMWNGLLKAKRLRDCVLEWCQAEGHIGEMSDGEDWYDREKWGLEFDLKKGEELDEEDTTATGKKTRHRRTARDA